MPNLFTLIGSAWRFYRKQPALTPVVVWFLFLPLTAINILARMIRPPLSGVMIPGTYDGMIAPSPSALLLFLPTIFVLSLIAIWGTACILLVGKRIIHSKAGRSRTSFSAVRKDALSYVFPLLLTGILRGCFMFFWTLLFIVPGIIYGIRTIFYEVVVVAEDLRYRTALQRSKQVVRGHSWRVLFYILGLSLLLFIPATIIATIVDLIIVNVNHRMLPLSDIVSAASMSFATMIYLLANIDLYGKLKKARPQHVEG
ncbi:hypothetical protein HYZ99_01405 [Candidatus Peregrinibacteria bacterium]|nr:hypothetical protein [Candidatus Peregrinibacteria bacterium]